MNNDLEGFGQWRRTVDSRLGTLETRVAEQASLRAQMDEDMSELKVEFRAQRTLLQALHDTQQEHSATLREHGVMLREHGAMLREHGAMLTDHGATLREHGTQLTALQTGQQRIMAGVDAIREMLGRTLNSGNE
jgi:uncharacterized coiled-coil protein SlyX